MRTTARWLGALLLLSCLAAQAQTPAERVTFLEPVVSADVLTLGWTPGEPYLPPALRGPGLRAGVLLPKFAASGRLGLFSSGSPFAGYAGVTGLTLDAELAPYLWKKDNTHAYGLVGLGAGSVLQVNSARAFLLPSASLTLGGGLRYFLSEKLAVGAETGLRTTFSFADGQVTTGLFVGLSGTWVLASLPASQVRLPQQQPPAAPPPASAPPERPAYGRSVRRCTTLLTDGWFAPTQGVFQDDTSFEDRPGKQLSRTPGEEVAYTAELNMVAHKDTVLVGVHHYNLNGRQVVVNSRDEIVFRGVSNCTVRVPVKLRFDYTNEAAVVGTLYTSPVLGEVPLEGPPGPGYVPWEIKLPAPTGIPANAPFRFTMPLLHHRITGRIIREDGQRTDLQVTVRTQVVPTLGPRVHFVPVLLSPLTDPAKEDSMKGIARMLAEETSLRVPDLFPLRPGSVPTSVKSLRNFSNLEIGSKWLRFRRIEALVAALNDALAGSAFLDGAGRVVALMTTADFDAVFGPGAAGVTVGTSFTPNLRGTTTARRVYPLSWKVILMPYYEGWDTVAHELVHSLPDGWAGDEMEAQCGRDYHNKKDPLAHGLRLTEEGAPVRLRKEGLVPLMGPDGSERDMWITQCTYAHLLWQLTQSPPDPPVLLLRAFVSNEGKRSQGELRPVYHLMGYSDLQPGKGGAWAFVLRDEKGEELGRYPFTPRFNDLEGGLRLSMASVVYRVPSPPGLASIELAGPGGVVDRKRLSAQPPELQILTPAEGERLAVEDGKVRVRWQGTGEGPLLYSVLYSADGGETFSTVSFEQKESELTVPVEPSGKEHQVRVLATDGTQSAEVTVPLLLQER